MPELVTGHEGATHVSSDDAGRFNACTLGFDDYLFTLPDGTVPQAVLEDANHVTIPVCDMMLEGRHVRVSSADSVVIESGGAGVKRRDLICIHYTRDSENVEKVVWEVVKGTPGSTVTTPDLPVTASILDMAEDVYVPVFRVDLDGITPSAPVCLLATFTPVQDSLTRMREYGFTTCSAGIATKAIPANGTHAFNSTWMRAFASTPQVVGWYANDNIWSVTVTNVTKTGARIIVRNVSSSINGVESRVYVTAYGQLA